MPRGGKREGAGRPKGSISKSTAELKAYAQEFTEDAIGVITMIMYYSIDPRLRVMAAKEILDRGHGRPAQGVELTGAEGGPIATVDMSNLEAARLAGYFIVQADNDKAA